MVILSFHFYLCKSIVIFLFELKFSTKNSVLYYIKNPFIIGITKSN
jgi:hypothetical protein